jgi:hypothetical protein
MGPPVLVPVEGGEWGAKTLLGWRDEAAFASINPP